MVYLVQLKLGITYRLLAFLMASAHDGSSEFLKHVTCDGTDETLVALVIYRFGNVLRSVIQVSMLLQTCQNRGIRIISTNDRIDTNGCPGECWQDMLMSLPTILRAEQIAATSAWNADLQFAVVPPSKARYENKEIRNNVIIELYLKGEPADQICDRTGVSHTTLFRVLRENKVKLFRHGQSDDKKKTDD